MKKNKIADIFKKREHFVVLGIVLIIAAATVLLLTGLSDGVDAKPAEFPDVYFEGEYRIGQGEWQRVIEGEHIPATKGDVLLRGVFHMHFAEKDEYLGLVKAGMPIAFFMDHIGITVYEKGQEPHVMDNENRIYGVSSCGQSRVAYSLFNGGEETVVILIHNPHKFGNETAIDDFLSNLTVWVNADLDRDILMEGRFQRNLAVVFLVIAFAFIGTAVFSSMLKIKNRRFIWLIGASVLFAGNYLLFSFKGICLWSNSAVLNTTMLCVSGIFYMMFLSFLASCALESTKRYAIFSATLLGVIDAAILIAPLLFEVYIYDLLWVWAIAQGVICLVLSSLLILEALRFRHKASIFKIVLSLLLLSFVIDMIGIKLALWDGGVVSSHVFVGALMFALVFVLQVVPQNLMAVSKAKEIELERVRLEAEKNAVEAELKERRVATMLSQIQPHFIYNTLGTIERLCLKSPEMASELVRNFSLYLRGNFSELDSIAPIRFSQEIKHVEHYVNIEKVRFPDMTIEYRLESIEFVLPALSVQPLVENAIKHGLMRLESGGTVVIHSYETETHFCVDVSDNGVGFDTSVPINKKEHVGIYNIRERLAAIVNGNLVIESEPGVGTRAMITIPKEDTL